MLKLHIKDSTVERREIKGKDGKLFTVYQQHAHCPVGDELRRITVRLPSEGAAYPTGHYVIDPSSVYVGQFGDLFFRRYLTLVKAA